ncbi:MAG TPA: Rieske 2Fe-2S domain-containing protein [Steroidobacteraceae bacterium]|nr:Rieske 2Fe-2S domain-containing protein [Steroidobacteraceae bacterium]
MSEPSLSELNVSDSPRLLCRLEQLSPGRCREFRLGAGDWPLRGFVLHTARGVRAYVNRCPHLDYPLNYLPDEFLTYDGSLVQCTMHGAVFEKDSGLCVRGPCLGRSLHALPVRIEAGCVLLADAVDIDALAARFA